jgi:hypothetical protein
MTGVQYRGRPADSDHSVGSKQYVDDRYATTKVDNAYVNSAVAAVGTTLVTPSYVDSEDALQAHKTDVTAADTLYVPVSSKGVANGVPSLDASVYIPSGQLGTVQTSRKPVAGGAATIILSGDRELLSINPKEYKVASLTIADPGFPYIAFAFASVRGGSVNGVQAGVDKGTGNYAQLSILGDLDDRRYGWMVTTGQKQIDTNMVVPYGELNSTPLTLTPVTGALTLDLYAGLYGGTTYTINSTSLAFWAIAYPAI